jgi:hypothetical protein
VAGLCCPGMNGVDSKGCSYAEKDRLRDDSGRGSGSVSCILLGCFRSSAALARRNLGLGFPETDAEVVLHCNSEIPSPVDVYYLVDDVVHSVGVLRQNGCTVIAEPFDIPIGKGAVVRDPFGTTLCMLDMSKGPRQPHAD